MKHPISLALAALCSIPSIADATPADLTITAVGFASWPAAVAAMQADTGAEGRVLAVRVFHDGAPAACGSYTLALDEVATAAFEIGSCDPTTQATRVVLRHRAALFAHDDLIPRPLAAGISATELLTGGAAGGAGSTGGSELLCSVAVRPYLTDMEHGTRVYLTPGRFTMRPLASGVRVETDAAGWTLRGDVHAEVSVDYEVLDTQRNTVVIRDRATLSCGSESLRAESAMAPPPDGTMTAVDPLTGAPLAPATIAAPALATPPPFTPQIAAYTPPSQPMRPRFVASIGVDLLGVGLVPMSNLTFHNGPRTMTGQQLGFGDFAGYTASLWGSIHTQGIYFATAGTIVAGDEHTFSMFELRATLAPALQHSGVLYYAGPSARISHVEVDTIRGATWSADTGATLGLEFGIRAFGGNRVSGSRRFHVAEAGLSAVVPIAGDGAWLFAAGISYGAGI